MFNKTALAAICAVSALVALPAGAADLNVSGAAKTSVRILVAGKTPTQLNAEITAAAKSVCTDRDGLNALCVTDAMEDAQTQLRLINDAARAAAPRAQAAIGATSIRIALQDKSAAQIGAEIQAAARTVCKNSGYEYSDLKACVASAVDNADLQLKTVMASAHAPGQLASN